MYEQREAIPEKYRWNLELMYPNVEAFEKEVSELQAEVGKFKEFEGTLLDSPETLKQALDFMINFRRRISNAYSYASQNSDLDTRDSSWQDAEMRMQMLWAKTAQESSYFVPELLQGDRETVLGMLEGESEKYLPMLDDIFRSKEHTLDAQQERLLALFSEVSNSAGNIYSCLSDADLTFPTIKDEKGEDVTLTHGNFIPMMMNHDRDVRKNAMEAYYSVYKGHRNALAAMLQGQVKANIANAKARKHSSARAAALFENNVPETVYDALIEAVHQALPSMYKYLDIRKKILGVDELHMYDVYVPLVQEKDSKIPFEDGRKMVEAALQPMGEDYLEKIREAFDNRWIDVFETPGKRSGAYSGGSYDSVPFVLLNHQDDLNTTFTLAHELGHSMHTYYSKLNQDFVNAGYSIFLAEIASTFNEALLNHHLLETETDPEKRKVIINNYLDAFKGTIFRQTMFAEFERDIHRTVEEGGSLTPEKLNAMYHDLNQLYFGDKMVVDEELDYEWSRIPHFYYNFYVFQYATGMSAATAFAKKVLAKEDGALEKYKGFLSAGSSKYPLEVLQDAGLDMTDPQVIIEALETFKQMVDEFEKLV